MVLRQNAQAESLEPTKRLIGYGSTALCAMLATFYGSYLIGATLLIGGCNILRNARYDMSKGESRGFALGRSFLYTGLAAGTGAALPFVGSTAATGLCQVSFRNVDMNEVCSKIANGVANTVTRLF
jgi:hypothetical protein